MRNWSSDQPPSWVTGLAARAVDPVELDQLGVVVDDHRCDVDRHALQGGVRAERLEPVAGVAVAEVDLALGEQVVDPAYGLLLGEAREVVVVHQEEVRRVTRGPLLLQRHHGVVVRGVVLDDDLHAVVLHGEVGGDALVGVDDLLGPVDREGHLGPRVRGRRRLGLGRAVVGGASRGRHEDDGDGGHTSTQRRPHHPHSTFPSHPPESGRVRETSSTAGHATISGHATPLFGAVSSGVPASTLAPCQRPGSAGPRSPSPRSDSSSTARSPAAP